MKHKILPPRQSIYLTHWKPEEIENACKISRDRLHHHLDELSHDDRLVTKLDLDELSHDNVENLFLVDTTTLREDADVKGIMYPSYSWSAPPRREWGGKDMMVDLGGQDLTSERRIAILTAAANLTGQTLHLLDLKSLTQEENRAWIEALSLAAAADRDATPQSLLIRGGDGSMDAHGLLSALKKSKGLQHLSLHFMEISDDCIEVLGHFASLISLHLQSVEISAEFAVKLAGLHPSDSPLAASLHRLHIYSKGMDWRRCTGFLHHWQNLKELSLESSGNGETDLQEFMEHLAKEEVGTDARPPQLYSLKLGLLLSVEFREVTIRAMVDALSRSGLPFFEYYHSPDPNDYKDHAAVKAQLWRNQRNFFLGSDLNRVPATSIRLFICGDPFAGKTTLVSTMRSIYRRKKDKLKALFTGDRTQGINVQSIKKDGIQVSLWDMAGQQEFHAFHDCMFPDIATSCYQLPSMFLFVWSPIDSENSDRGHMKTMADFEASFRYWLKFLASKSHQSNIALKVIVVFSRSDQVEFVSSSLSASIESLRLEFKWLIDIVDPPLEVDARKKDSVKAVGECIFRIAKEVLEGIEVYDICTHISKYLWNHSKNTNEKIITWMKFSEICNIDGPLPNPFNEKDKLNIIALSLNESGNIIYINGIKHIILDPNWFCNQIVGNLIDFPNSKGLSKGAISFNKGCIPRNFLEQKFESITRSQVKGSILVDLMEAMHLCYKVPVLSNTTIEWIFIPAILSKDEVGEQPLWTPIDDDKEDTLVYMGRRLECENKNHTFLTPRLFPRIQMLFNNAFQSEDDKAKVTLGKDFISIHFPKSEVIIMLCQAKSNYVIDVLVRAQNNTKEKTLSTLSFVQKRIINTLMTICAQPTGIQGVKLIESVIRPDCLYNPSNAQEREDQCVKISYLKEQLQGKLEEGNEEFYEWTCTRHKYHSLTSDWIDLLGLEYYEEVLNSCKHWFQVEVRNALLENNEVCVNVSREYESHENVITTSLENDLVQVGQTSKGTMEIQTSKFMVRSISSLRPNMDATHEEVLKLYNVNPRTKKLEEIHKELQCMREDVISKVEKSVNRFLAMAPENEVDKQLPRVAFLMFRFLNLRMGRLLRFVPQFSEGEFVTIQLYCEHKRLPHPVKDQPGITLTSLSKSRLRNLNKALPYINGFLRVLIIAARLGISSVVPIVSSLIPDWSLQFKQLANGYPMIQNTIKSKEDTYLSTLESASKEWQKCLALILEENGGLSEENIFKKFLLKCANHEVDGRTQVAWLCETHYQEKGPFH